MQRRALFVVEVVSTYLDELQFEVLRRIDWLVQHITCKLARQAESTCTENDRVSERERERESMTYFDLVPSQRVGPLEFGMTRADVATVLGPVMKQTVNKEGDLEEYRDEVTVRFDPQQQRLVEIAFCPGQKVLLDGVSILDWSDPVSLLTARGGRVVECLGFLVFLDLGIALTGYHDEAVEQRALTVFATGRWDVMHAHFVPWS